MCAGNRVIVDNQDGHLLRTNFFPFLYIFFSGRIRQGNRDQECGALSFLTLHFNIAIHHLHDVFCNGKSQSGAAVFVGGRRILLRKGFEKMRKKFLTNTDSGILNGEADGCLSFESGFPFHHKLDQSAGRGKFHCIPQDIDQHLAQLHIIADIIIIHFSINMALVVQPLILALPAEHGIDGFQHFGE